MHRSRRLKASDKLLAYTLSYYMDEDGYCFPSQAELARTSRLHPKTIRAASLRLIGAGYLKRRSTKASAGTRYLYWARVPGDRDTLPERRDPFDGGTTNVFGGG